MATGMVTGAFSSVLDWLYPLRVVAAAWVLWIFRRHYTHLGWSLSWRAVAIGVMTFGIWLVLAPAGQTARVGWPAALDAAPTHWAAAWLLFESSALPSPFHSSRNWRFVPTSRGA